jgi:hypothetical protein
MAAHLGRVVIWTLLGPLMKIVDIVWVRHRFKTNEDLLDDILHGAQDIDHGFQPLFDSIVEHDTFQSMRKRGRLVAEEAVKLKDMRDTLYGTWSEMVPCVDNSRRPSIPLPPSSATPWTADCDWKQKATWDFAPGKKLVGDMIMECPGAGCHGSNHCLGQVSVAESKKKQ